MLFSVVRRENTRLKGVAKSEYAVCNLVPSPGRRVREQYLLLLDRHTGDRHIIVGGVASDRALFSERENKVGSAWNSTVLGGTIEGGSVAAVAWLLHVSLVRSKRQITYINGLKGWPQTGEIRL
jgi:hypothetical protein